MVRRSRQTNTPSAPKGTIESLWNLNKQQKIVKFRRENNSTNPLGGAQPHPAQVDQVLVVDLYCGMGGFSCGAARAGARVVLAVDIDPDAIAVHKMNHPTSRHLQMELGAETEDRLVQEMRAAVGESEWHLHGSPPCTLLSPIMACNARHGGQNRDVERGLIAVKWFFSLVEKMRPTTFSFENVRDVTLRALLDEKQIEHGDFDFSQYGVPQTRKRLLAGSSVLIQTLKTEERLKTEPISIEETLDCLPKNAIWMRSSAGRYHEKYYRTFDLPSWTIMTRTKPSFVSKSGKLVRVLTCDELALLQGFDKVYKTPVEQCSDVKWTILLGNALPPPIADRLLRVVTRGRD